MQCFPRNSTAMSSLWVYMQSSMDSEVCKALMSFSAAGTTFCQGSSLPCQCATWGSQAESWLRCIVAASWPFRVSRIWVFRSDPTGRPNSLLAPAPITNVVWSSSVILRKQRRLLSGANQARESDWRNWVALWPRGADDLRGLGSACVRALASVGLRFVRCSARLQRMWRHRMQITLLSSSSQATRHLFE